MLPMFCVPPAGLPKDGNGPDQQVYIGRLVIEGSFDLPASVSRS